MINDEEIKKSIIELVVNKLVAKKKLLAKNESLPSKFYDEALEKLLKWGCGIEKEALKKRVNRAFAKESASLLTPIPPAVASDSSKKSGGRPKGTTSAKQYDDEKRYKECLNSITTEYANGRERSEMTLKPIPKGFLRDLIQKKKSEFNVTANITHTTISSRVSRNKSDPDKHKLTQCTQVLRGRRRRGRTKKEKLVRGKQLKESEEMM